MLLSDVYDLVELAEQHGDLEGTDAWISDLEGLLIAAWLLLTAEQQAALMSCQKVADLVAVTAD